MPSARPFSKDLLMERSSLFSFYTASRIHPAPLARPFSKGLLMEQIHSLFLLYRLEESILRLWRAPSSRGYSISKTPFFHLTPVTSH